MFIKIKGEILKKNLSILIYEKEKILNSILHHQILNYNNHTVLSTKNHEEFIEILAKRKFDTIILNLNYLVTEDDSITEIFKSKNKYVNIIAFHDPKFKILAQNTRNMRKLYLLEKPFKLNNLLKYLDKINTPKNFHSSKYLMNHIIFSPSKKIISNLETNNIEHLTEKENNLLIYLYNKKNEEILKNDLLRKIWGVSDKINTHTLETHIYRLKQKLYKLDKNLSLSLTNRNGLYSLKYTN